VPAVLGPLVLRDHALNLDQERILRVVRRRPIEKDDGCTTCGELLEQQHLVRVAPRESVGVMHVDDVDRTLGDPIAQPFERRTLLRRR
jgi:hypothetical protein